MIIKGGARSNSGFFAAYLSAEPGQDNDNDRVTQMEIRGTAADTIDGFFQEIGAVASGTNTTNFFYHAHLNPHRADKLDAEQWDEAIDILEEKLGFTGQPRIVVEHEKPDGRVHRHVIWSRIYLATMTAIDCGNNFQKHERAARAIEERFNLVRVESVLEAGRSTTRPERRPQDWEGYRAQATGVSPEAMKAEFTELWKASDGGKAFKASIEERGYILAPGNRRDFVVVDAVGDVHSLARRLAGVKAPEMRLKMADIDRSTLPTIEEAQATQRARSAARDSFDRDAANLAWEDRVNNAAIAHDAAQQPKTAQDPLQGSTPTPEGDPKRDLGRDAGNVRMAWSLTDSGPGFAAAMQDRGYITAEVSAEDARASERAHAFAKELDRYSPRLKEGELVVVNRYGGVTRINERSTGDTREAIAQHLAGIDRRNLMSVADAQDVMKAVAQQQWYAETQAARPFTRVEAIVADRMQQAEWRGPSIKLMDFGGAFTIARATAADIGQLRAEHEERQAAFDPELRRAPPRMNEGDLFAISRNGHAHRLNPFKLDFQKIEQRMSDEGLKLGSVGEVRAAKAQEAADRTAAREQRRADHWQTKEVHDRWYQPQERGQSGDGVAEAGLRVKDNAGKVLGGLADVAISIMSLFDSAPPPPRNPHLERQLARERAIDALENIRTSIERDASVNIEDLKKLTPQHRESLAKHGDLAMHSFLQRQEERDQRDRYGGDRER